MLEELLEVVERLAALVWIALVPLTADFVLDDVGELVLKHLLDGGLFLNDCEAWIMSDLLLEVHRLLLAYGSFLSLRSFL